MGSGYSPAAMAAFELLFRPWMRRRVRVRLAGPSGPVPDGPLLLVANHVSWWDAFLLRELQRRLRPGAPIRTVMLRGELRRRPLFAWIGAVGIEPGAPASVAGALRRLRRATLERPDTAVLFFPQGRIWPSHRRPLGFQRGVELFARGLAPATVLPVALHLEPLSHPAPTAFVAAGMPRRADDPALSAEALEREVERLLDGVLRFVARHGEEAPRLWPGGGDPAATAHPAPVEGSP